MSGYYIERIEDETIEAKLRQNIVNLERQLTQKELEIDAYKSRIARLELEIIHAWGPS